MFNFLKNHLRIIVRSLVNEILLEKTITESSLNQSYQEIATFNKDEVRFELTSSIANNRTEKKYIKIGDNSWIQGQLLLFKHGGEIVIGRDCFIGKDSKVWSSSRIVIGDRVLISHNVNIHDNIAHPLDSKQRHLDYLHVRKSGLKSNYEINEEEISIGDDVWIGFNSTILKGVKIGNCAIVGANTVVTSDVPENAVVVGNPAKIIKHTT